MQNFDEANLPQFLSTRLKKMEFLTPTPIQAMAIPHALAGKDLLASAQTGTGKTLAYGLPLLTKLINNPFSTALILLPTRELAMQVMESLQQIAGIEKTNFGDFRRSKKKPAAEKEKAKKSEINIKTALLIGGADIRLQMQQLKKSPRLIVGTPGRVHDHLQRGLLKLNKTEILVLDEADRMLDMGFGVQLEAIAPFLTSDKRQTLMFSATLPRNIEKLAESYLTEPLRLSAGAANCPAEKVKQSQIKLTNAQKHGQLTKELQERSGSIIIFVKTKHAADDLAFQLQKEGHEADALHGDLRQNRRSKVITNFRKQKYRILVATDVAARGLDIPHIDHVINFDLPQNPEDYIHRIGRTARGNAKGEAVNFLSPQDSAKWKAIFKLLNPGAKEEASFSSPKRTTAKHPFNGKQNERKAAGPRKTGENAQKKTNKFSNNGKSGAKNEKFVSNHRPKKKPQFKRNKQVA